MSGAALAVNAERIKSFFPLVYNEDWLFLIPSLRYGLVAAEGSVDQEVYDPFSDPRRATGEEFGDVLGEGLIAHMRAGSADSTQSPFFWESFLDRRQRFIREAIAGCERVSDANAPAALNALILAEDARARLSPVELSDYVTAWHEDLRRWRRYFTRISVRMDVTVALEDLALKSWTVEPTAA